VSDHHLPPDPAEWPSDPYALLGVPRLAAPRDLKRAYTKLIRIFKPELYPDEFRRIRSAFEDAQRWAQFSGFVPEPQPPEELPRPEPAPVAEPAELEWPRTPRPKSVHDEAVELWDRAISGDVTGAYHGLTSLLDREPGTASLYARLYWLLVLEPAAAPGVQPAEWLTRGLSRASDGSLLFALYRDEVRNNPDEAGTERGLRVVASDLPAGERVELAAARWDTLARVERWAHLREEWPVVRTALVAADETGWLRLVCTVAGWVEWDRSHWATDALAAIVRKDLKSLEHLALRHSYWFDHFDQLLAAVRSWKAVKREGPWAEEFLAAVRFGWGRPVSDVRPAIERTLRSMSEDPATWVRLFDDVGPESSAALEAFGNLLSGYQNEIGVFDQSPYPSKVLLDVIADTLIQPGRGRPDRSRIMQFCLDECVLPRDIHDAWAADGSQAPEWLEQANADIVLHHVCRACRLFRA
jgi:hypothetical protein